MRATLDHLLRLGIKVCMLTGVAFTFAACYGPAPERWIHDEPEYQQDQQLLEKKLELQQQLQQAANTVEEAE